MKKTQKTILTGKVLRKLMEDEQCFKYEANMVKVRNYIAELAKELFNVEIHVAELNDKDGEWVKTMISAYNINTGELVSRIEKV
jgi:hypothetical protein